MTMMATAERDNDLGHTMQCMEVWGGNEAVDRVLGFSGLDVWVLSRPSGRAAAGGDLHYLSSCATGRVARLLVADVAGHGSRVAPISELLRGLLRRFVNFIDQSALVAELNRGFMHGEEVGMNAGTFATAVVMSWFGPENEMTICNAGHPAPFLSRFAERSWATVGLEDDDGCEGPLRNLPLGVIEDPVYDCRSLDLLAGDRLLVFTDAVLETFGRGSARRGVDELRTFLEARPVNEEPGELMQVLVAELDRLGGDDDLTIVIVRPNGRKPWQTFGRRIGGPLRVVGAVIRGLAGRLPVIPWPEMSLANIGGALIEPLNRCRKKRSRRS